VVRATAATLRIGCRIEYGLRSMSNGRVHRRRILMGDSRRPGEKHGRSFWPATCVAIRRIQSWLESLSTAVELEVPDGERTD